ncbi:muellerian-inhibiting factor [Paroedura picta]|uniref:muellerian-inhibiting factor n=1 Tax=Paroedura picta TaxID=143630 RepID=UPI004055F018
MRVAVEGVLLGVLLFLMSVPGEGTSAGEETWWEQPDVSALREAETQEPVPFARVSALRGPGPKAAANGPEGDREQSPYQQLAEEEETSQGLWPRSASQAWPNGGSEEPVCRVKLDGSGNRVPNHLEVVGLLSSHERGFLKALSRSTWSDRDLEEFGLCPPDVPHALLASLQRVGGYLADSGDSRFILLHLEEVQWKAETKLRFQLTFPEDMDPPLGPLQLAFLVFYHGGKEGAATSPREKFIVSGEGLYQKQILCLSRVTRYLVLKGSLLSGRNLPGQLSFRVSLAIRRGSNRDVALSPQEAQDLLFGFDEKCFTRMTPSVLLVAKQRPDGAAAGSSSFLAAQGVLDTAPYLKPSGLPAFGVTEPPGNATARRQNISVPALPLSTGQFLEALSQFVNQVLWPFGKPPPTARSRLQLDFDTVEALPHWSFNLSEEVALEWLVQSEDHVVVLFPEDSQALMEQDLGQRYLEGRLLWQLLAKLSSIIQEVKSLPSFQTNARLFHNLLASCYYPSGSAPESANSDSRATGQQEGMSRRRKLHSLLLLKALQALRGHWRESRKPPRANRSTQPQEDYCRLQELRVDLVSMGYIILPEWYHANNCVGPCRSPLSTRITDYYSHTLFLLRMHEQGLLLQRAPCCVPVKYSQSIILTFTNDQGLKVKKYPDMVAEACGCR